MTKLAQIYCWDISKNKNRFGFGDLDPISKVIKVLRMLEMACLAYVFKERLDFDKLVQIYHSVGDKYCLDFSDLDFITKDAQTLRMLENGLSALYLLKE